MMCVCRSEPFSDSGAEIRFDRRTPNCNLIRLFYASMMGHCQMLRRQLLDVIPTEQEQPEIYRRTCYDVMTATAAAALDSIVLIDRLLVKQRRYEQAATYVRVDHHRVRRADNALYMIWYGVCNYRRVKPWMNAHFAARRDFLEWVWRKSMAAHCEAPGSMPTADNRIFADGIRLLHNECRRGLTALLGIERYYINTDTRCSTHARRTPWLCCVPWCIRSCRYTTTAILPSASRQWAKKTERKNKMKVYFYHTQTYNTALGEWARASFRRISVRSVPSGRPWHRRSVAPLAP